MNIKKQFKTNKTKLIIFEYFFELFGYTSDGSYTSLGKYTTDKHGRIDISMSTDNLEYNTQYYIVETKAPEGYLLSAVLKVQKASDLYKPQVQE